MQHAVNVDLNRGQWLALVVGGIIYALVAAGCVVLIAGAHGTEWLPLVCAPVPVLGGVLVLRLVRRFT